MNKRTRSKGGLSWRLGAGLLAFCATTMQTEAALSDGLVSYWPMEEVQGTRTPDLVSGYDMTLNNLTAADLVAGKQGKAFSFANARQTLLSRVHDAADDLPANKHAAFTITLWANVNGTGQTDLRLFSEGFTPNNNTPLFNLGTDNTGATGSLDIFIRNSGWTEVAHPKTIAQPFDGTWHHVTFVQNADGTRQVYVDGVLDTVEILPRPEGAFPLNDTTIGGILRASASHWVTGLIDEVAIWKRALSQAEITQVVNEGLVSIFPPESIGLVSHWPMEVVQGTKTPDVVSGYDMNLNNLTEADLVIGKFGKAFSFVNARQTLLSRIHEAHEDLPANKHPAFTVSLWANVVGTGQSDLRVFSEAFTPNNNNPLFNLGTHSGGADGALDLYIRNTGWATVDHPKTTAQPFDGTWHHVTFVQNADGTRQIFVDGVLDPLEILPRDAGAFQGNDTTIGGILRASASHWVTGLIDEVAIWKRALAPAEILKIMNDGVPAVFSQQGPLELKSFTSDFPAVAAGDKVTLHWEGSSDASYTLSGVGDVSGDTDFGVGSREVTVTSTTTYNLTATRGGESLSKELTVTAVGGVAPGWHLIDTFSSYTNGPLLGQGPWLAADGIFNVVDLGGTNTVLGYADGADLTAIRLHGFTIPEGQRGTLSFRLYAVKVPVGELIPAIGLHIGLTDRPIRFVGDFNQNVGPYLRVERFPDFDSVDLMARNGVATGFYEGAFFGAVMSGEWYRFWINVENKPFNVVDGFQTGGDTYSIYYRKESETTRTTFVENFVADRDAVAIDPALGAPTPDLTHVFISSPGAAQGTNMVLIDDIFVSVGEFKSDVPYTPPTGPTEITITGSAHANGQFTVTWASLPGTPYIVQRKATLGSAWVNAATVNGAAGATTSYSENAAAATGFYQVVFQP